MFFHSILSANRKRRSLTVSAALWMLRLVRDAEKDEMFRIEHECYIYDRDSENVFIRDYGALEDEWSLCECALGFVDCAVNDLEFLLGSFVYGK